MDSAGTDTCAIPAGPPPAGQSTNFVNPDTLAPEAIGVCTTVTVLAVLFAAVRLYTNRKNIALADCECVLMLLQVLSVITKHPKTSYWWGH